MKILKRILPGFIVFFAGVAIIYTYAFFSPYKIGPHTQGSLSVFNVLFTVLFLTACCVTAYLFGKRGNKGVLAGLICIFTVNIIVILQAFIWMFLQFTPGFVMNYSLLIFFSYATLFLHIYGIFYGPPIMIILISVLWYIGYRRGREI